MASAKQIAANRLNARLASGPKTEEGRRRSTVNARKHGLTQPVQVSEFGRHLLAVEALLLRDEFESTQAQELALCILDYERNLQHLRDQFAWSEQTGLQLREGTQVGAEHLSSAQEVANITAQIQMKLSRQEKSVLNGLANLYRRQAKDQIRKEEQALRSADRHYRRAANQLLKCLRSVVL